MFRPKFRYTDKIVNNLTLIVAARAIKTLDMSEDPKLQNKVWGFWHAIRIQEKFKEQEKD